MYFTPINGTFKAKCDVCGNEYSYSGGSTSNLSMHIRNKHPSLAGDMPSRRRKLAAKVNNSTITSADQADNGRRQSATITRNDDQPDPSSSSSAVDATNNETVDVTAVGLTNPAARTVKHSSLSKYVTRPASVTRQRRLNDLLLKMLVVDFQPFSIVQDAGFQEFVKALDPSFVIPSRKSLSGDVLLAKYNQAVEAVKQKLSSVEAVTLTTDSWTSICTENYIAVTAYYVTDDFELGSCLLECFKYGESHMADNLKTEMMRVVDA